jgi:hypothetical protein
MEIYHVYPIDDIEKHELEGYNCHCNPKVEYNQESNSIMVIHNSFDGRELVEQAKEILGL